jgi:tetratricopeptide (TPR) repeat protein
MFLSLLLFFSMSPLVPHEGLHEQIQKINLRLELEPGDAQLYLKRAELYRLHQDWKLARADLDQVVQLAPGLTEQKLERALLEQKLGQDENALRLIDDYLQQRPQVARALDLRARLLFNLKHYEDSALAFETALGRLANPQPDHFFRWARALESCPEKGVERALASVELGLKKLGACMPLELLAVEFESKLHQPKAALQRLDRLRQGLKRQESWLIRRGDVLWDNHQVDLAKAEYQAALDAIEKLRPRTRGTRAVAKLQDHAILRLKAGR